MKNCGQRVHKAIFDGEFVEEMLRSLSEVKDHNFRQKLQKVQECQFPRWCSMLSVHVTLLLNRVTLPELTLLNPLYSK